MLFFSKERSQWFHWLFLLSDSKEIKNLDSLGYRGSPTARSSILFKT
jgi:hypothetical protein